MIKRIFLAITLFTLLLVPMVVQAQTDDLIIQSDSQTLDEAAIREAAQPLLDRGAVVAVYLADSGEAAEFDRRLREADLMRGDLIYNSLIAVFVSLDDRYYEILGGDNWWSALGRRAEGIGSSALRPSLQAGNYTRAFELALEEIETVLAAANLTAAVEDEGFSRRPSGPGLGSSPIPNYPSSSPESGNGIMPMLMFCLLPFMVVAWIMQQVFGDGTYNSGYGRGYGGGYTSSRRSPTFKSGWSSGSSSRSSGRSGGFGSGGRSSGKW